MKEFEFLKAELDKMKENKTWQQMKQIETKQGPSVEVKGENVIQLSSNNYLGLTSHPRLVEVNAPRKNSERVRVRPDNRRNIHNAQ